LYPPRSENPAATPTDAAAEVPAPTLIPEELHPEIVDDFSATINAMLSAAFRRPAGSEAVQALMDLGEGRRGRFLATLRELLQRPERYGDPGLLLMAVRARLNPS
jgi:hypothetical protein